MASEHLRMNGAYWGITAMALMGGLDEMEEERIVPWIIACQHENGGYAGAIGHDPHILSTLSAIQILGLYDRLGEVDGDRVAACMPQTHLPRMPRRCLPSSLRVEQM